MFPSNLVMVWLYWHILVEGDHVRPLVVVGTTEEVRQEEHHRRVQLRDITHIL